VSAAAIYTARGALFATYSRAGGEVTFPQLPGEDGIEITGHELVSFKRIESDGEILGTAYIRADYRIVDRLWGYLGIVTGVTLVALAVAIGVSLWLQSMITKPILSIADVAKRILASGEYSYRAPPGGNDEVGTLSDSFNAMLVEIERRTDELERTNRSLDQEVAERQRVEDELKQLNVELERRIAERTAQLEQSNDELESFSYSVSHDLRGPLRAIDGFSEALGKEIGDGSSESAQKYFERIRAGVKRMGHLIEDLLNLARVSRSELQIQALDLSAMSEQVIDDLRNTDSDRNVEASVWQGMHASADPRLIRAAMENLVGNAWKFTANVENARIEVGTMRDGSRTVYFVRDNGAGFDMAYADKLFGAFQRLHSASEFPGTGIGLATVQRIVHRHGGRVWADSSPGNGAAFYFTLDSVGGPA
jgi:signal transduction histidine kinase